MITKPTVLVLGAGASIPYNFPSGRGLLDEICTALEPARIKTNDGFVVELRRAGCNDLELANFREHLFNSGKESVDAFLEHRPEFLRVGKLAIAARLLPREHPENLIKISRRGRSWYELLFNKMNSRFDEFGENRLAIITYNYDRSLEEYLYTAMKYSYDRPEGELRTALQAIPLIHLHGQLGLHPSRADPGKGAGYTPATIGLSSAAEGIKVVHEGAADDDEFKEAQRLLDQAEFVCFLGFGYHAVNIERLRMKGAVNRYFFGSTFGMAAGQIETAERRLPGMYPPHRRLGDATDDCYDYLRAVSVLD